MWSPQLLFHLLNYIRMKNILTVILVLIVLVGGGIGLSYGVGWIGVHQTKTIGKASQNAKREVYEQNQSRVDGKRQEALKLYREYLKADEDEKIAIKEIVAFSFAEFDEDKLHGKVKLFVYNCKYNL